MRMVNAQKLGGKGLIHADENFVKEEILEDNEVVVLGGEGMIKMYLRKEFWEYNFISFIRNEDERTMMMMVAKGP